MMRTTFFFFLGILGEMQVMAQGFEHGSKTDDGYNGINPTYTGPPWDSSNALTYGAPATQFQSYATGGSYYSKSTIVVSSFSAAIPTEIASASASSASPSSSVPTLSKSSTTTSSASSTSSSIAATTILGTSGTTTAPLAVSTGAAAKPEHHRVFGGTNVITVLVGLVAAMV